MVWSVFILGSLCVAFYDILGWQILPASLAGA